MGQRIIAVDVPLSLRRTLGYVTLTWGAFRQDGWWRPMRTPDGPATVKVTRDARGVVGEAWGEGGDWALARLDQLVGLHDEPESFAPEHPIVRDLHRRYRAVRFGSTGLVFDAMVWAILSQKVTGREAKSGLRAIGRSFSDPAPGPDVGLLLPPDPERLAATPYYRFHELGIEKRRTDTLRRASAAAPQLERTVAIDPRDARAVMERIPGVGEWTSAETVLVSHGDQDAVSVGDYHLKHLVSWHLAGEARGTDERMLELLEPFRPHRGRVIRLLETAGHYPRFGPRMPVRSFSDY